MVKTRSAGHLLDEDLGDEDEVVAVRARTAEAKRAMYAYLLGHVTPRTLAPGKHVVGLAWSTVGQALTQLALTLDPAPDPEHSGLPGVVDTSAQARCSSRPTTIGSKPVRGKRLGRVTGAVAALYASASASSTPPMPAAVTPNRRARRRPGLGAGVRACTSCAPVAIAPPSPRPAAAVRTTPALLVALPVQDTPGRGRRISNRRNSDRVAGLTRPRRVSQPRAAGETLHRPPNVAASSVSPGLQAEPALPHHAVTVGESLRHPGTAGERRVTPHLLRAVQRAQA